MKLSKYPLMASYHTIQSFNHTSLISYEHRIMSSPNTYPYVSRPNDDNSDDEILEILSNFHPPFRASILDEEEDNKYISSGKVEDNKSILSNKAELTI